MRAIIQVFLILFIVSYPARSGFGNELSEETAVMMAELRVQAEAGDAAAQFNLGIMYDELESLPNGKSEALKWYRRAAEQGYADALFRVGQRYAEGEGVAVDQPEALKWYKLAAEQNHADAQYELGSAYKDEENDIPVDKIQAFKWLVIAAENGIDAGMSLLFLSADMSKEELFEADSLAAKWLEAHKNVTPKMAGAMLEVLAQIATEAPGPEGDQLRSLVKGARAGDPEAQFELGTYYQSGNGVPEDSGVAFAWFKRAADQGHAEAQASLGVVYMICRDKSVTGATCPIGPLAAGPGSPLYEKYSAEMYKWFHLAADQGSEQAYLLLFRVNRSAQEGVDWLMKAAALGNHFATVNLGNIYTNGWRGIPIDLVKGYMWDSLIKEGWFRQRRLAALAQKMSPEQIAEAERLAAEWRQKHKKN